MPNTDIVLFDLDGTLLDTEADFTLILNRMLEQEKRHPVSAARVRRTVSSGGRALVSMAFSMTEDSPGFDALVANFLDQYETQISNTRSVLFPGVETLLDNLESAGLKWAIVTNKISRFTLPLLERIPALADCATVVCRDHVTHGKPWPEPLLLACDQAGIPPSRAVYIGDHPRDVEAAQRAEMPVVAVAWGFLPDGDPIERWGADYIARDTHELESWLLTHV